MFYWLAIIICVFTAILILNRFKNSFSTKKKLALIKARWGKPVYADRNFNLISRYLTIYNHKSNVSAETDADLDIDSVFSFIDRTNSKPGQQYLYKRLRTIDTVNNAFDPLEKRIEDLCKDENTRQQIELKLSGLNSSDAYYLPDLFYKKHTSFFNKAIEAYVKLSPILLLSLIVLLSVVPNQIWLILIMAQLVTNAGLHFWNKNNILSYTHSLPQLLILNKVARWLMAAGFLEQNDEINYSLIKVSQLKKTLSIINFQNKLAMDPTDITYLVNEWFKILFLTEPLIFLFSIKKINNCLNEIKVLYEAVAEVDVLISIQSVRDGLPYYCKPGFNADINKIIISQLYHPLIENCVANSIKSDNSRIVLITGSNMSGKTTFIRAVAINALMAQTIHTCCASVYQAPPLKILTSIHMNDDMDAHKSYFQAEALSILDIVNQSNITEPVKSLVIIDEIFRGTNTIERIAAAMSVLSYLIDNKNFVFVSTHDLELAELLGNNTVYSFEELFVDNKLVFDYKIKEGVLKNKNGIAVLQRLGYPQSIIDQAYKASKQLWDKYEL
jgi:hypothetical protein